MRLFTYLSFMKSSIKHILILFLVGSIAGFNLAFSPSSSTVEEACEIMHHGTFTYQGDNGEVKVVIDGNSHTEYHNKGKHYLKSTLKWINACEYDMTLSEINLPDFPFKKGDVMHVKINKVEGKTIHYTSTVKGNSFTGTIKKIKD